MTVKNDRLRIRRRIYNTFPRLVTESALSSIRRGQFANELLRSDANSFPRQQKERSKKKGRERESQSERVITRISVTTIYARVHRGQTLYENTFTCVERKDKSR